LEAAEEEEGCPKMGQYNTERGGTELVYLDFSGTSFVVEVYIKFFTKLLFGSIGVMMSVALIILVEAELSK